VRYTLIMFGEREKRTAPSEVSRLHGEGARKDLSASWEKNTVPHDSEKGVLPASIAI
jgi:hypothetical protein